MVNIATKNIPIPTTEEKRLHTLGVLNLLDSPQDSDFDKITLQAKAMFNVPIALISLIDRDRQWFKSRCGIDAEQTSRDVAFCAHAIMKDSVLVVLDATKDERFKDNILVTGEPHIRFYAGAPIIIPDGLILGTLCVIDTKAREEFSANEIYALQVLADEISCLIKNQAESVSA